MNIIFTVCNRTTLANALALGKSAMQYPGNLFYLCWVDSAKIPNVPDGIKVISVDQIQIPQWETMKTHYYDFELLPACRPWFAKFILSQHREQFNLIFFAPTVLLLSPLDEILRSDSEMQLTPHITKPLSKSSILDDKRILNIGMFHSGSWILRRSESSLNFLDWWSVRTIDRAKFDLCGGMCLDQLWLNFSLVRMPSASQTIHPGWHLGLHNILNNKIFVNNGKYTVDGSDLISVDFAGLDTFDPIWSDYKFLLNENKSFKDLYKQYREGLTAFKALLPDEKKPGFGLIQKRNGALTKKISGTLRSVNQFIDQF